MSSNFALTSATTEAGAAPNLQANDTGVWRDGDILVMHKEAVLPDRCIKCNAPCNGYRLKRNLSWHRPAWFLLIFISLWIYLIVFAAGLLLVEWITYHRRITV